MPGVAQSLRNLVSGGHEPGGDTDAQVEDEGSADAEPSEEVVQAVLDQNQIAERGVLAHRPVAVVPVQVLLEQEEGSEGDAGHVHRELVARLLDRLRGATRA
jgi:hypothetical protein